MSKIAPEKCVHRNIHPGRVDGAGTVCHDCKQTVIVKVLKYANGKTMDEDYADRCTQLAGT